MTSRPFRSASGPIRIANCSGFYGDRLSAAAEMVNDGPIDVLTGDWLAELTMLILARTRERRPGGGYARSFVKQMEQVMGTCLDTGIKVVSNAGGLDPRGCAQAVAEVAERLGLRPRIAFVDGDDLMARLGPGAADAVTLRSFATGEPMTDTSDLITANAYLGGWGIAEALRRGADVVVTGRVTDAAVACGPAAWHHGWAVDDWDALAGAVAAGHVIECGTQATGGNYSFFTEVEGMDRAGFPWAEIAADGSSVIGKHDGTGGEVTVGTVTAQLLYEIDAPGYLGPDVTARFDTIRLTQAGSDRVRIDSVRGEPPPPTLKVATNQLGGYRSEINVALTGLDIDAKAALVHDAFWRACPHDPGDYAKVTERVVRTDKTDPATNEEAVAVWRLTVFDHDEDRLGRTLSDATNELALATIPGMFSAGSAARPRAFGVYRPATVPAETVPQYVTFLDGERTVVDPVPVPVAPVPPVPSPAAAAAVRDWGPVVRAPLGRVAGTRSGDKGGNANLGVFARSADAFEWLDGFLTTERVRELLPEAAPLRVDRHRLGNIWSLNFVVHGLLGDGVAASDRQDPQAKSLGEWLRARVVDVPETLLDR
ncbi:MAG: DUF1446 domain-containing protein [Acidimicrobiaceae bacterium]|nr:DUF1446 domain-containing protein [Acidimicrobiaceae bacterium]MXZ99702.1 DUF1446 domain-containing protein [Acidimicrobiaceae bacterium]MYE76404.1 DUF1446 domain-containing protein [Acidimicrobiaceae bacterium]MYE97089.1 DUF1446 domain-containing protein [Acidimicrobiaceae bacterium]MYI52780.1 DUF1446 domain-containing protein [Acidimicrobiaceae bacterium]